MYLGPKLFRNIKKNFKPNFVLFLFHFDIREAFLTVFITILKRRKHSIHLGEIDLI